MRYTREAIWHDDKLLFGNDLQYEKSSAALYGDYGLTLSEAGDTSDTTAQYFKKSLEIAPNQSQAYNNLGILYDRRGNIENAKISFLLAINHGASSTSYVTYIKVLIKHKEYQQAIDFILNKALFLFPENPDVYHGLVLAYSALGEMQKAALAQQDENRYSQNQPAAPAN